MIRSLQVSFCMKRLLLLLALVGWSTTISSADVADSKSVEAQIDYYRGKVVELRKSVCVKAEAFDTVAAEAQKAQRALLEKYAAQLDKVLDEQLKAVAALDKQYQELSEIKTMVQARQAERDALRADISGRSDCSAKPEANQPTPGNNASSGTPNNTNNAGPAAAKPGDLSISPTFLDFGRQKLGIASEPKEVTITNVSNKDVTLAIPQIIGRNGSDSFELVDNHCGGTLPAKAKCTLQVRFLPLSFKKESPATQKVRPETIRPEKAFIPVASDPADIVRFQASLAGLTANALPSTTLPFIQASGTPIPWDHPVTRMVVGLDASATSSQSVQQQYFVEVNLTAPIRIFSRKPDTDPLERSLWLFLNPRIAGLPTRNSNAAVTSLNTQASFLNGVLEGKIADITQGLDFTGGVEWVCPVLCVKPRDGWSWRSNQNNQLVTARLSTALVFGAGASTPFSTNGEKPPAFLINQSMRESFGCVTTTPPTTPAAFCPDLATQPNVAFVYPDRSRFFYKFYTGVRIKTHFFSREVKADCGDPNNGGRAPEECDAPEDMFPGVIDVTAGKDAAMTGGRLTRWLLRLDAVYPLPFARGLHIYGSTYMGFGKTAESRPFTLQPVDDATEANTVRILLPRPNRDFFRIGVGFDIAELIKSRKNSADKNKKE